MLAWYDLKSWCRWQKEAIKEPFINKLLALASISLGLFTETQ
jgi:hypothetical protein